MRQMCVFGHKKSEWNSLRTRVTAFRLLKMHINIWNVLICTKAKAVPNFCILYFIKMFYVLNNESRKYFLNVFFFHLIHFIFFFK